MVQISPPDPARDLLGEDTAAALDEPLVHLGVDPRLPPLPGLQPGAQVTRVGHRGETESKMYFHTIIK